MNSGAEDISINQLVQDEAAATNQLPNSDNNANPSNNPNQSKGAIPKAKNALRTTTIPKKTTKLNNNIEDSSTPKNITCSSEEILHIHNDVLRFNGLSDRMCRFSSSCTEEYQNVLYNTTNSSYESIPSALNRTSNHINDVQFNHMHATNSSARHSISTDTPLTFPLNLPGTSNSAEKINNQVKLESDSSSDDNDLLSISDDGCIYTYKGDHAADLPSSFFSLDVPLAESPEVVVHNREQNASPEMDYLEMDFDPGPSGDADSDCGSSADLEIAENLPKDTEPFNELQENYVYLENQAACSSNVKNIESKNDRKECTCLSQQPSNIFCDLSKPGPSTSQSNFLGNYPVTKANRPTCLPTMREKPKVIKMPWSCTVAQRTTSNSVLRLSRRHQNTLGELFSPSEKLHSPTMDFSKCSEDEDGGLENIMIWSPQEAAVKQVSQISVSACGATAVLNVLNALRLPVPPIDKIKDIVLTRLRANTSPLAEYLQSRSVAGCNHVELIKGLETISNGNIYARFFHMHPERVVNLYSWLGFWIKHGAVPIATLNLQKCMGTIPDAWHHQMIFGVGSQGIYLTNPLECVEAGHLWPQLCSESVLLIRREDILSRWNVKTDLLELMKIQDSKWRKINVVGQVANMVRESMRDLRPGFKNTTHIKIPASYSSGITLAVQVNSPVFQLLRLCPELPLLDLGEAEAAGCSDTFY